MYNNNNKPMSAVNNTITVTPIKMEQVTNAQTAYSSATVTSTNITNKRFKYSTAPAATLPPTSNNIATLSTVVTAATTTTTVAAPNKTKQTAKAQRIAAIKRPPPTLDNFWPNIVQDVNNMPLVDSKHQALPLARIKKIMKLDENAKMIAAEAPLLFAKACEYFIQELTMRAWIHTEENKRRTLQRSDIAQAIAFYDQFDFLIDIVPREDIKPSNHRKDTSGSSSTTTTNSNSFTGSTTQHTANSSSNNSNNNNNSASSSSLKMDQPTEYLTLSTITPDATATTTQQAQPAQQQLQIIQHAQPQQYFIAQHPTQQLILTANPGNSGTQLAGLNLLQQQPQQLILTTGPNGQLTATPAPTQQQTALLQKLAQQQQQQAVQQQQQQIQLLQQVVSPTGEITNVPISINASQLGLLQMQSQQQQQQHQQQQQQQQVIIPAQCLTTQQLLQLSGAGNAVLTAQQPQQQAIFINAATGAPAQVQLQTVQQQQQQSSDRNITTSYRSC